MQDEQTLNYYFEENNTTFLTGRYVQTGNYISLYSPRKDSLKKSQNLYCDKYRVEKRKNVKLKAENLKILKEVKNTKKRRRI